MPLEALPTTHQLSQKGLSRWLGSFFGLSPALHPQLPLRRRPSGSLFLNHMGSKKALVNPTAMGPVFCQPTPFQRPSWRNSLSRGLQVQHWERGCPGPLATGLLLPIQL